jgi:hypothetical protein
MSSPVSYDLQGQGGGIVLDSASAIPAGRFRWIQVITDAVFDGIESDNIENISQMYGVTVPAGVGIGGRFFDLSVSSGIVIAYYA